jgi:hypothetical protein
MNELGIRALAVLFSVVVKRARKTKLESDTVARILLPAIKTATTLVSKTIRRRKIKRQLVKWSCSSFL